MSLKKMGKNCYIDNITIANNGTIMDYILLIMVIYCI